MLLEQKSHWKSLLGKIFMALSNGSFFTEDVKGTFAFYLRSPVAVSYVREDAVEENFTNAQSTMRSQIK